MASVESILKMLGAETDPKNLEGMRRYGININNRLGASVPAMRKLAKELGKNHALALELWATGFEDARILAGMVDDPAKVTEKQMDDWVRDFDSWDVCDQVCMNLFDKTPFAAKKIREWSLRDEEYVKRAAFTLLACVAWHDKKMKDEQLIEFFPIIKGGASDDRNYVKKAVSWALRHIGKRNLNLNKAAIALAKEIQQTDSKPARWVANGALKELESQAVQKRLRAK